MDLRRRPTLPSKLASTKVKTEVKRIDSKALGKRYLSSATTVECYNFTGHVIRSVDNLGLCTTHNPATTSPDEPSFIGCFVIKRISEVHNETQITECTDSTKGGDRVNTASNEFLSELLVDINHKARSDLVRRSSVVYYSVPYQLLRESNGSVFVSDANLLILSTDAPRNVVHPFTNKGIDTIIDQLYESIHTYSIEINDPDEGGDYFASISDRVYRIKPTAYQNIGAEARIIFKPPNQQAQTIYVGPLDPEALASFGIFRKYEDADMYGNKFELAQKQLELDQIKAKGELETKKVEAASKSVDIKLQDAESHLAIKLKELEAKQIQQELEHRRALEKMEREKEESRRELIYERERSEMNMQHLRMKDYYENRSHDRKDSSEFVKFMPAMLGAGMALFALMK